MHDKQEEIRNGQVYIKKNIYSFIIIKFVVMQLKIGMSRIRKKMYLVFYWRKNARSS